ncbi:MAG: hypothetical protein JNJ83_04525 [Verrucomicrobiaceae bacterium]|nr:hypothetical protein [Verrucomicrobiaceae bacterium]
MKNHRFPFHAFVCALCLVSCERQEAADQSVASAAPVKPRPHAEILKVVDFSLFPQVEGASRHYADAVRVGFSLPKKDASDVQRSIQAMEQFLSAHGWKVAPEGAAWTEDGGEVFYLKDSVVIQAVVGVTPSFGGRQPDVNAGLFLAGDVDARTLPRVPGSVLQRESRVSSMVICPVDLLEVRKFNKEQLSAQGWLLYRDYFPGYEPKEEELEQTQSFTQNGATLRFRLTRKDGNTEVSLNSGVLSASLPIMEEPDMLKLRESPPLVSYWVRKASADVIAWHMETLRKLGWSGKEVPATEERTTRHEFQKTGNKPLYLVLLPSKNDTIVQLHE